MSTLAAIYKLTLRSILRERVALSMLVLLALVQILLPMGLKGDGTPQGEIHMHIRYSLGFSIILLAGMMLWASCASIAGDLSSKRLHMVLTKPVSRAALWWGKWLAVTTLGTSLLLVCGVITLFRIQYLVAHSDLSSAEEEQLRRQTLTSRVPIDPVREDLSPRAEKMLKEQRERGALPPNLPEEVLQREVMNYVRLMRHAADAGASVEWTFHLDQPLRQGESFQLAYTFDGASMGVTRLPGTWRISTPDASGVFTTSVRHIPRGEFVIPLRAEGALAGADTLTVRFDNKSETSDRVFFKPDGGVRLYRHGGSFVPNLLRALLLPAGLLALLAAVGVSAGAVFSLPVACYVTAVFLFVRAFSGVVEDVVAQQSSHQAETKESFWAETTHTARLTVYKGILLILDPLDVRHPLDRVSRGIRVSSEEVLSTLGLRFLPILLFIGAGGIVCFSRRETGAAA